jgi:hypothetical protein
VEERTLDAGALDGGRPDGAPVVVRPGSRPRLVVPVLALLLAVAGLVLGGASPAGAGPTVGSGIDHIDVALGSQRVRVWGTDGSLMKEFPVSTGSRGRTPSGSFRVYRRSASTVSTTDYITTMQWMTNFTGGIGFHGIPRKYGQALYTPLGERPVSAGCVRMADEDAEWIYRNVPNGTRVNVK